MKISVLLYVFLSLFLLTYVYFYPHVPVAICFTPARLSHHNLSKTLLYMCIYTSNKDRYLNMISLAFLIIRLIFLIIRLIYPAMRQSAILWCVAGSCVLNPSIACQSYNRLNCALLTIYPFYHVHRNWLHQPTVAYSTGW